MEKLLTTRYLLYRFFSSMWFMGAVWLYFYRLFITDQQVGLLDGMAFAIGLVAEVPSGALADKFGRDKIVRLGQILAGFGLIIQALGSNFFPFFVGQAVVMIGASFSSGADEALFFQRLDYKSDSVKWRKLVTRGGQVALLGSVIALTSGGLLHGVNPRIPWLLSGFAFIVSAIVIWSIKDTRKERTRQAFTPEIKEYLGDIVKGFREFTKPKFSFYIPLIIMVQGLFYTAGWGILRVILLDRFHFSPILGSFAIASVAIITVGMLHFMHQNAEKLSEKNVLSFISIAAASSLLLSIANIGLWGYFVILILYAGEHVLYPFMSEVINNRAEENQRATVLSVASFLRILPYIALAPIIGYLNTNKHLEYFLVAWAILIGLALLIYLLNKKGDIKVAIEDGI